MMPLDLAAKIKNIKKSTDKRTKIMIIGLGSVGCYLLDYLLSDSDSGFDIIVAGRNFDKIKSDVNIISVASIIRNKKRSNVIIDSEVDLEDVDTIAKSIEVNSPDIIVNSSRAYAHIKYGAISWNNIRAYGIWTPLSIKYTKNIMAAYEKANSSAIVINTSYSDAVIPWLKSAGKAYPDLGSGNVNHLIPRIRMKVGQMCNIEDIWNLDITFPIAHFHDVVISKEGHTEGIKALIDISYNGKALEVDIDEVFKGCAIAMPVDAKRNMMNASSNYDIIRGVLDCIKGDHRAKLHSPGAFGEIGGYPVILESKGDDISAYIDDSVFSLEDMRAKNRESIYLDGVEDVRDGCLIYTDELLDKVDKVFNTKLPKTIEFGEIDNVAGFIIENIIERYGK